MVTGRHRCRSSQYTHALGSGKVCASLSIIHRMVKPAQNGALSDQKVCYCSWEAALLPHSWTTTTPEHSCSGTVTHVLQRFHSYYFWPMACFSRITRISYWLMTPSIRVVVQDSSRVRCILTFRTYSTVVVWKNQLVGSDSPWAVCTCRCVQTCAW